MLSTSECKRRIFTLINSTPGALDVLPDRHPGLGTCQVVNFPEQSDRNAIDYHANEFVVSAMLVEHTRQVAIGPSFEGTNPVDVP